MKTLTLEQITGYQVVTQADTTELAVALCVAMECDAEAQARYLEIWGVEWSVDKLGGGGFELLNERTSNSNASSTTQRTVVGRR